MKVVVRKQLAIFPDASLLHNLPHGKDLKRFWRHGQAVVDPIDNVQLNSCSCQMFGRRSADAPSLDCTADQSQNRVLLRDAPYSDTAHITCPFLGAHSLPTEQGRIGQPKVPKLLHRGPSAAACRAYLGLS